MFCLICHDFISAGQDNIVIPNSSSSVAGGDENLNRHGPSDPDAGALLGGSRVSDGSSDITNMVNHMVVDDNVDNNVDDNVDDNVDHKIHKDVDDFDSDEDDGKQNQSVSMVSSLTAISEMTPQENSSIDIRIALLNLMAGKENSDVIVVNGVEHIMSFDPVPNPDGRGVKTYMFANEFSTSIPPLYWYRFYAGYVTTKTAMVGMCMTECGNMLVGILETRCNTPRYDAAFYYAKTKECVILKPFAYKNIVLCPKAPLTIDINEVQL
jgi:hypothetical protein